MGAVRFLLWTGCAVGLGIFLATWRTQGRTPVEHAQGAWHRAEGAWRAGSGPAQMNEWKGEATGLWQRVRDAVLGPDEAPAKRNVARAGEPASAPAERHSPEDRRALDRLIRGRPGSDTASR